MPSLLAASISPTPTLDHVRGFFLLAGVMLIAGIGTVALLAWLLARFILTPPRMTDARALVLLRRMSPDDLGLPYESLRFTVESPQGGQRVNLAAWWIPAATPSPRCTILLHSHGDAKVGALGYAPMWHKMGINVLALDLRAHGESEGRHSTGGFLERLDLVQVIDQLVAQQPGMTRQLVLMGINLGANVALATALLLQEHSTDARPALAAVVLDGLTGNYPRAVLRHAGAMNLGSGWLTRFAAAWAARLAHADFPQVDPLALLRQLRGPLLLVQSEADDYVDPQTATDLRDAAHARPDAASMTLVWQMKGPQEIEEYPVRLQAFCVAELKAYSLPNAAQISDNCR